MKRVFMVCLLFSLFLCSGVCAGEADVIDVKVNKKANNLYDFNVTVLHKDTGWDHYADQWEVADQEGKVLGTRVLYHPHVDEQPFTRSLSGVHIPADVKKVKVRAHDRVHAYGGKVVTVQLP